MRFGRGGCILAIFLEPAFCLLRGEARDRGRVESLSNILH